MSCWSSDEAGDSVSADERGAKMWTAMPTAISPTRIQKPTASSLAAVSAVARKTTRGDVVTADAPVLAVDHSDGPGGD